MELGVAVYSLQLNETIVRLNAGADYFTNAGRTSQNGVELSTKFKTRIGLSGWYSHTFNHYRFKDYVLGADDFSGNEVTGTAPSVIASGLDYRFKGLYTNITVNYVDEMPLNDANSAYSDSYFLAGIRLGYRNKMGSGPFEFFGGVDNLLNEKYSLGNDFNAVGGRYFNAATGRNFYFGFQLRVPLLKIQ
jgi:iron complex outermembrane receptor protein